MSRVFRPIDKAVAFMIGDDIFVSYARSDGAVYAAGVATKLASRGFSCRLDQWGTESGSEVPPSLRTALRRSAALIVVGTAGAAHSKHVSEEVREMKRLGRPIVPIIFPGVRLLNNKTADGEKIVPISEAVEQGLVANSKEALWAEAVQGLPMSCECNDLLESGEPSREVLNRIEKTFEFWTKDKRLQISSAVVATVLLLLIGGSVLAARVALRNGRQAMLAQHEANKQEQLARNASKAAKTQEEVAESARKQAQLETERAAMAAKQADHFALEAQQQQHVAEARQLTNEATLILNQHPERLVAGSVQALRATKLDPSAESDEVLRTITGMLPEKIWDTQETIGTASVAFASNDILVVAAIEGVSLWNQGKRKATITDPFFQPTAVKVSPDSRYLLIGSRRQVEPPGLYDLSPEDATELRSLPPGKLRLWDLVENHEVWNVRCDEPVTSIALSTDSKMVAVGTGTLTDRGSVQELKFADGSPIHQRESKFGVTALAFSPDGKYIAISSKIMSGISGIRGEVEVVTADLGKSVWSTTTDEGRVNGIAISPDSRRLAVAGYNEVNRSWETQIWDAENRRIETREKEATEVNAVCFLDNSRLLTAGGDLNGRGWGRALEVVADRLREFVRFPQRGRVLALACDPSSNTVLVGYEDGASVWSLTPRREYLRLPHGDDVTAMDFRADGAELVTGTWDEGAVRVWRASDWTEQSRMETFRQLELVSLSPDGESVFAKPFGLQVGVFGRASKSLGWGAKFSSNSHIAVSSDWHYLVIASQDKREIRLYDFKTKQKTTTAQVNGQIEDIAFSSNGKFVAGGFSRTLDVGAIVGSFVELWRVENDQFADLGQLHFSEVVMKVGLSRNGSLVAVATLGGDIHVFDIATRRELCSLALRSDVNSVSFSNDEKYLAVATGDELVHILDSGHCAERARISHNGPVFVLSFSPGDRFLLTGSGEKVVRILRWRTTDVASDLCSRLLPAVQGWSYGGSELKDLEIACGCEAEVAWMGR